MSSTTILDSAENTLSLLREYTASACSLIMILHVPKTTGASKRKAGEESRRAAQWWHKEGHQNQNTSPWQPKESATGGPCWLGWRWCWLRKELCWDRKATQWDWDPHKEAPGMSNSPARSTLVQSGHPDMAAVCREEKACTKGDWAQIYLEDNGRHISHY